MAASASTGTSRNLRDVSLADMSLFENGAPWELFEQMRNEDPCHWSNEEGGAGFWSLTRYADIVSVLRDTETFNSEQGTNLEELDDEQLEVRRSMLETDGSRHRVLRKLMMDNFTPKSVAGYTNFLEALTKTTLDAAFLKNQFEFVKEISADFPIRVLARMLGVPDTDTGQLINWGNRMVGNTDPEHSDVLLDSEESEQYRLLPFRSPAALEVFDYGFKLREARRGKSENDLVSQLAHNIPTDGLALDDRDFRNYFLLIVIAGNETTRHAITHSMNALIDHPEQMALLKAKPELIPWAIEEFLRQASPVYHFRRTATRDVEMHGKKIKKGQKVVVWFASGNRDPETFAHPYSFDVTRRPNEHMAFGRGGPHMCMGNALARLEMQIMFTQLLPRVKHMKRIGETDYLRSNFVHGIKRLPVQVEFE